MRKGEIWWASVPDPVESSPGYRRPVIIIQANSFNESKICTVIVVTITSNILLADAPGNVFLSSSSTGLPKDSVANVSRVITIDKSFLTEKVDVLTQELIHELELGLRMVLDL